MQAAQDGTELKFKQPGKLSQQADPT